MALSVEQKDKHIWFPSGDIKTNTRTHTFRLKKKNLRYNQYTFGISVGTPKVRGPLKPGNLGHGLFGLMDNTLLGYMHPQEYICTFLMVHMGQRD